MWPLSPSFVLPSLIVVGVDQWPIKAVLYGSIANGLAIRSSDIDIAICGLTDCGQLQRVTYMQMLGYSFQSQPLVQSCATIVTSRVPVIKLVAVLHICL